MPWDNVRLTKAEKRIESKMILCLEMPLSKSEIRGETMTIRWLDVIPDSWKQRWPCISVTKVEKEEAVHWIFVSRPCVCISAVFDSLHQSIRSSILAHKRKRKETEFNFVHQPHCLSLYTTILALIYFALFLFFIHFLYLFIFFTFYLMFYLFIYFNLFSFLLSIFTFSICIRLFSSGSVEICLCLHLNMSSKHLIRSLFCSGKLSIALVSSR